MVSATAKFGFSAMALLLAPLRLLVVAEVEMHGREVIMGIVQTGIDGNHALKQLLRLLQAPAVMRAHAEQVRSIDMIRKRFEYLTAERLGLGISALAIGGRSGGEDGVRLLHQFLLQSRILECARAGAAALQGVSPEDGPGRV
ncbi:acetolactate synthase small subunit [Bradyrhizobium sp. LB1.3]